MLIIGDVLKGISPKESDRKNKFVVPNEVKKIEDSVFHNSNSKKIVLPKNLEKIGRNTFGNCKFKKIKIPKDIVNLSKYIKDYADTASLLLDLDLLITVDSSIAHAAGALGIKTFLLLPKTPEWRWFDDEEKCSWYDSIRIFKQKKSNDWQDVISRVEEELKLL